MQRKPSETVAFLFNKEYRNLQLSESWKLDIWLAHQTFQPNHFYLIQNLGNNFKSIFVEERNHFLELRQNTSAK